MSLGGFPPLAVPENNMTTVAAPSPAVDVTPPTETEPLRPKGRGGFRRLIRSLVRVGDLQLKIWLTHAKLTLQRMMIYAALFGAAAVLGLLAIIFLYIGVFKVLTDVIGLRPVWAYLIYGGFHIALAIGLVVVGTSILNKKDDDDDKHNKHDKHKHQHEPHHHSHDSANH